MKILIAVSSCVKDLKDGRNQAIRDTWLSDIKDFPNLDCKFFIGNGKLKEIPHSEFEKSWNEKNDWITNVVRPTYGKQVENLFPDDLKLMDDEIVLDTPDSYKYLPFKTKESHIYAIEKGYDYVFQCFTDTYIVINNLMNSGFESHDYIGHKVSGYFGTYASGGPGYWLSAKACRLLKKSPIIHWAEDVWVGHVMKKYNIKLIEDSRYDDWGKDKCCWKDISKHLCFANEKKNVCSLMKDFYVNYKNMAKRQRVLEGL